MDFGIGEDKWQILGFRILSINEVDYNSDLEFGQLLGNKPKIEYAGATFF